MQIVTCPSRAASDVPDNWTHYKAKLLTRHHGPSFRTMKNVHKIWGYHGGDYSDYSVLGCDMHQHFGASGCLHPQKNNFHRNQSLNSINRKNDKKFWEDLIWPSGKLLLAFPSTQPFLVPSSEGLTCFTVSRLQESLTFTTHGVFNAGWTAQKTPRPTVLFLSVYSFLRERVYRDSA